MARRNRKGRRSGKGTRSAQPQEVHPNAAGLDVGATKVYAAVRAERAEQPIQSFPTFTRDLHALADWLSACQAPHRAGSDRSWHGRNRGASVYWAT